MKRYIIWSQRDEGFMEKDQATQTTRFTTDIMRATDMGAADATRIAQQENFLVIIPSPYCTAFFT